MVWRPVSCCCIDVQQRHHTCYVQCTVLAIKAVLCIEINYCCHSCRRLFPQWWPRSGCTRCTVYCTFSFLTQVSTAHVAFSFANFANVRVLCIISLQQAYFRSPLRRFRQRESASRTLFRFSKRLTLSLAPISQCTAHRLQFLFVS
jgi:hypothetical protein